MATLIPEPPVEGTDPWFQERENFDEAVRTRLNIELSDANLDSRYGASHESLTISANRTINAVNDRIYEINATAPVTVTLAGPLGTKCSIFWSGASGTIAGQTIASGDSYDATRLASGWQLSPGVGTSNTNFIQLFESALL